MLQLMYISNYKTMRMLRDSVVEGWLNMLVNSIVIAEAGMCCSKYFRIEASSQ